MVQDTKALQQVALLRAELERAQATAAANLEGWQRAYADLQRSEADAAAFLESLQRARTELEQTRLDMSASQGALQRTLVELDAARAVPKQDPEMLRELDLLRNENIMLQRMRAEFESVSAIANSAAELKEELDKARADSAANLDGWQRTRAEFANYKKRTDAQSVETRQFAALSLIGKLLPVNDDFERAANHMPEALAGDTWLQGLMLVQRKLRALLDAEGVKAIEINANDVFDPAQHEAVSHEDAEGIESGHVIEELQKGYKIGERVIRPTMVRVAK